MSDPSRPFVARDLLLPPGLLSLARVPLAIAFPFVVERPVVALVVLLSAGVTDVLDGWLARRYGWVTTAGAMIDGVTDKLFVLTVAVTLLVVREVTPLALAALSTRELGEAPLVAWLALSPQARARRGKVMANVQGKVATCFQFAAVACVIARAKLAEPAIAAAAAAGALAAASYWVRALRAPPAA